MRYLYFLFFFLAFSCYPKKTQLNAQEIIDKAMLISGVSKLTNAEMTFKFRGKKYSAYRRNTAFYLSRKYKQEGLFIQETLSNKGYQRLENAKPVTLSDSLISIHSNAINSVHYFAALPYKLNDKAVIKKLLPEVTIKGKAYYKIEISFDAEGGGKDYNDVFIYWVDKQHFFIDYVAYSYHTNGGGKRFRAVSNEQWVADIRFLDYHNYRPSNKEILLVNLDKAFVNNQLTKVSEINLEQLKVSLFPN